MTTEKIIRIAKRYVAQADTRYVRGWGSQKLWLACVADYAVNAFESGDRHEALQWLLYIARGGY